MPTYQYACTDPACGNRFELVQSFTDPSASECPVCQGPVRKVFSNVGVVFKGSGFYRNDSRASNGSGSKEKSGSDGGDSAKSDSSAKSADSGSSSSGSSGGESGSSSKDSGSSSKSKNSSNGSAGKTAASA